MGQRRISIKTQSLEYRWQILGPKQIDEESLLPALTIDERRDPVGPCASQGQRRCSDKGFLPMLLKDYQELLGVTGSCWELLGVTGSYWIADGTSGKPTVDRPHQYIRTASTARFARLSV